MAIKCQINLTRFDKNRGKNGNHFLQIQSFAIEKNTTISNDKFEYHFESSIEWLISDIM